jgi:DNA-binding transcriptional MerR regulator
MRIGEVAEQAKVPSKTIRYYEDVGLLPEPPRTPSGYREYGPDAVDRLGFIQAAQSIGLSLGEIREILSLRDQGEAPCAHVATLIDQHASDLAERIRHLREIQRELRRLATMARSLPRTSGKFCHIIEVARPSWKAGRT